MGQPAYHFVINPAAGNGRGRRNWEQLEPELSRAGISYTARMTTGPGDGQPQTLAAVAAAAPGDVIVAIGGDGTAGEVAGGLVQSNRASELALGVISSGTGNDLARTLGLPGDARQAFDVIAAGKKATLDAGMASGHCFLNVAGVGFDAAVANAANKSPKFLGGTVPYVLGLLRTLWGYRPVPMELDVDGTVYEGRFLLVAVANGRYFGGGMKIAPQAEVADGAFDVVMAGDLGRLETLRMLPRIYKGTHVSHPKVVIVRARQIGVRVKGELYCQADGELLPTVPTEFSVRSHALSVLVP